MNIGIIAENYFPTLGGIQEHIYYLSKQLMAENHNVKVITGNHKVKQWIGPKDEDLVIRVGDSIRYGIMGTYTNFTLGFQIARNLRRIFDQYKFDVLHIHGPFDFGLPMLAYKMFNGPIVATLHSAFKDSWLRRLSSIYYKWVIKHTDAVIGVSQHAVNSLLRYADFPYHIIPNGVDVKSFEKGRMIERYNDGKKNILYLGRVEPRNGLDLLLKTLSGILKVNPNIRILVAGDGPELTKYKLLLSSKEKEHVVFLGAVYEERADLFKTADLFVLPNRFGGTFSILVLEALAAGTPIVSTPFVPEECRDDHWRSVVICNDYSEESLAGSILGSLEADQAERIILGKQIVKKYDWSFVAKSILDIYRQQIGN